VQAIKQTYFYISSFKMKAALFKVLLNVNFHYKNLTFFGAPTKKA
ncbi:MAG: hypothetical protein ACI9RV_000364, partial [Glaciecola sp.]